jgi:cubilin
MMLYCAFFFMQIYDGFDIHSRLIGTYCGTQRESFSSSRNSLTFQFSSDSSKSGRGFLLEWFAVDVSNVTLPTIAPGVFGNIVEFFSRNGV